MNNESVVLRTLYVTKQTDVRLREESSLLGIADGDYVRNLVALGLREDRSSGRSLDAASGDDDNLIMRTWFVPRDLDHKLEQSARAFGIKKGAFVRCLVLEQLEVNRKSKPKTNRRRLLAFA